VQRLAQHLVSLADASYLTNQQVDTIAGMWQELAPHDKQRVIYRPRYKATRAAVGRLARREGSTVTAGTESVKR